ncbi:nudix-type nucleoside diphosphatase, YffH/AdpP family [endosymbiont of Ridgeia piscesae]|jgi:ADP-ribose pyrophosphatase|uniref:ADP-ribose pyrophosphatase n=2 Tax=endosymbiont of Ridgeia piscesae TaxID=54398 RepID=A0A0T5YZH2_9GAMM|nr:nudix-type nucleoside diphosphatase, YffH/AdpP family [endosymbiont of Ridgeia piscesae]KRT57621.1 ADP-ribose pyrophosphatase [endosymbiont of Ridgeia piscesae]
MLLDTLFTGTKETLSFMKYGYRIVDSERVYDGFLKLNRYRLKHELYEGGESRELVRERVEQLRASMVLLYDPHRDQMILVEQFRIGALGAVKPPWVLEVIGGYVGEAESSAEVARREAMEEANCQVGRLEHITQFMVNPGLSVDRIDLYCGEVDASAAGGVHGLKHEGEDIRVVVMDADQALAELYGGRANSTSIIIALQWFQLNREQLRQRWFAEG